MCSFVKRAHSNSGGKDLQMSKQCKRVLGAVRGDVQNKEGVRRSTAMLQPVHEAPSLPTYGKHILIESL